MNIELRRDAMYANDEKLIYRARNLVCRGDNFYDTGFAPFSSENINKDFKIIVRMSSFSGNYGMQNVVLGCKYEGTLNGLSWPGFYWRLNSQATSMELGGYNYYTFSVASALGKNLFFWRKNGIYKCHFEGDAERTLSVRSTVFNQPIIIGAGMQTNGTKFRYATCAIDYVCIEYLTE